MTANKTKQPILEKMIEELAQNLRQDKALNMPYYHEQFLVGAPETYTQLFKLLCEMPQNKSVPSEESIACLTLLQIALAEIRRQRERDQPWAVRLYAETQTFFARYLHRLPQILKPLLVSVLGEARFELSEELKAAFYNSGNNTTAKHAAKAPKTPVALVHTLISELGSSNPFELCHMMVEQGRIAPIEQQIEFAYGLNQSDEPIVQEILVLMLLHPNQKVRAHIPEVLLKGVNHITPRGLRWMIGLRNWLPETEREKLDEAIKAVRTRGIECEPQPAATLNKIQVSTFDGAGAQMIVMQGTKNNRCYVGGFIVKDNVGMREPWIYPETSEQNFKIITEDSYPQSESCALQAVRREYIEKVVNHYIAVGLKAGRVPELGLLEIAECMGITQWRSEYCDIHQEIKPLLNEAQQKLSSPDFIQASLQRSARWFGTEAFARTWFEDDEKDVDFLYALHEKYEDCEIGEADEKMLQEIITHILEPKREKWLKKLFWMTLWTKHSHGKRNKMWVDFLLLTKLIAEGKSLKDIPFMRKLADASTGPFLLNCVV